MLLAVDIGNTNTVFAVYKKDELLGSWRLRSDSGYSADEYASFLSDLLAIADVQWTDIKTAIVSSVVPEANLGITQFCDRYLSVQPVFVTKDMVGVSADIDRPEDIGADRLVNAVAVHAEHEMPAIVVDFGTATTFDVIDGDGNYAGGVIAPGVNLSMSALHQAASKLPKVSLRKPDQALGKNTVDAMRSGMYWGYVGLVDRVLDELKSDMDDVKTVIATGGLAPLFAEDNASIDLVDSDLTLRGLHIIAKKQGPV